MSRGFAVLVVVGGLATIPITAQAEEPPAPPPGDTAAVQPSSGTTPKPAVVTLPTGERVRVASADGSRSVRLVEPADRSAKSAAKADEPTRIRTMDVGNHYYVVPDAALPYLGRQLDLALFDVLAPPTQLTVEWAPGASTHTVPGLKLDPVGGGRSTGRITDPAAFGATLAQAEAHTLAADPTAGPLAGILAVRPATDAPPPVKPHFALTNLTVDGLDANGVGAMGGTVSVTNADDNQRFSSMQSFIGGTASFSVPEGNYSVEVSITTRSAQGQYVSDSLMVYPQVEITGDKVTMTADARTAKTKVPVPATPKVSSMEQMIVSYSRVTAAGTSSTTSIMMVGGTPELMVSPTEPVSVGKFHWYTYFRLISPVTAAEPYLYDLLFPAEGAVPSKFAALISDDSLATAEVAYHAGSAQPIGNSRTSFLPWEQFPIRSSSTVTAPLRRTEYVTALPDVGWVGTTVAKPAENNGVAQSAMRVYEAGQHTTDQFLAVPAVPGADRNTMRAAPCPICRQGDNLSLNLQTWTDSAGHALRLAGSDTTTISTLTTLGADGVPIGDTTDPAGTLEVPTAAKRLQLTLKSEVSADWFTSASVNTTWTWPTAPPTEPAPAGRTCPDPASACALQPLLFAEYDIGAGLTNTVPAGKPLEVAVTVRHQAHDPGPAADELTLEASTDDGVTWQPATVKAGSDGRFTATVTPDAGSLSLRIHATDPDGSTLDQTVIGAARVTK